MTARDARLHGRRRQGDPVDGRRRSRPRWMNHELALGSCPSLPPTLGLQHRPGRATPASHSRSSSRKHGGSRPRSANRDDPKGTAVPQWPACSFPTRGETRSRSLAAARRLPALPTRPEEQCGFEKRSNTQTPLDRVDQLPVLGRGVSICWFGSSSGL